MDSYDSHGTVVWDYFPARNGARGMALKSACSDQATWSNYYLISS